MAISKRSVEKMSKISRLPCDYSGCLNYAYYINIRLEKYRGGNKNEALKKSINLCWRHFQENTKEVVNKNGDFIMMMCKDLEGNKCNRKIYSFDKVTELYSCERYQEKYPVIKEQISY